MDYSKIYIELMERANDRVIEGYTEKHHIVPKCMGGDNKPRNIVKLTPEEHYVAHQLLVKIYPKNSKLIYACRSMVMTNNGLRVKMKAYGWLRRKFSEKMSIAKMGANNPNYGKVPWNKGNRLTKPKPRKPRENSYQIAEKAYKNKPNPLGVPGVKLTQNGERFSARISLNGKRYNLGTFASLEEASLGIINFKINNPL